MAKLKERQFYNVGKGKNETVPEEFIDINKKQIELLQVQIEELKASSSNPLAN